MQGIRLPGARRCLTPGVAILAVLLATAASGQAAWSAHGSVKQVYVTELDANAQMSLLDPLALALARGAAVFWDRTLAFGRDRGGPDAAGHSVAHPPAG